MIRDSKYQIILLNNQGVRGEYKDENYLRARIMKDNCPLDRCEKNGKIT